MATSTHIYISIFILLLISSLRLYGQQYDYAQFYSHKMNLNPAYTGFEKGIRFNTINRIQWHKLDDEQAKFRVDGFGLSTQIEKINHLGFGLVYNKNREGNGLLTQNMLGEGFAIQSKSCEDYGDFEGFNIRAGMQATFNWHRLGWDNFIFSNQLHPLYGNIYPSNINSGNFPNQNGYYNLNAGVMLEHNFKARKDQGFRLGVAASNLMRRNVSLINGVDQVGRRYTIHGTLFSDGYNRSLQFEYDLVAFFKFDFQQIAYDEAAFKNLFFKTVNLGAVWEKDFSMVPINSKAEARDGKLHLGAFLHQVLPTRRLDLNYNPRNINGIGFLAGADIPGLARVLFSYQFDFSRLNTSIGGIWELSLNFAIRNQAVMSCKSNYNGNYCPAF